MLECIKIVIEDDEKDFNIDHCPSARENFRNDSLFKGYWGDPDFIELTKDTNKAE